MDISFFYYLAIPIAYVIGSISCAILVCRLFGLPDPRTEGSNNPGATNVMRIGGKKAAILTLFGDLLKGLIPVLVVNFLEFPAIIVALTAIAAFLGHLYPLFFQFKGGKGVATALGCILGLNLWVALCAFAVWLAIFITTRISSLSALIAACSAPLFLWVFQASPYVVAAIIVMDILLIVRHKTNIQRLLTGQEGKIKLKK